MIEPREPQVADYDRQQYLEASNTTLEALETKLMLEGAFVDRDEFGEALSLKDPETGQEWSLQKQQGIVQLTKSHRDDSGQVDSLDNYYFEDGGLRHVVAELDNEFDADEWIKNSGLPSREEIDKLPVEERQRLIAKVFEDFEDYVNDEIVKHGVNRAFNSREVPPEEQLQLVEEVLATVPNTSYS